MNKEVHLLTLFFEKELVVKNECKIKSNGGSVTYKMLNKNPFFLAYSQNSKKNLLPKIRAFEISELLFRVIRVASFSDIFCDVYFLEPCR